MALQNYVDKVGPAISAAWLNVVDTLKFTIFGDSATKAAARAALTSDAPLEQANGGTGSRGSGASWLTFLASFFPSLWQYINPQTANEAAASVVPSNYAYLPGDARRYNWLAANTAAQNATAVSTAITALNGLGGTTTLPTGTYAISPFTIPAGVIVRGAGKRSTILQYTSSGSGALVTLGGTSSSLYYGTGLTDLTVQLTGTQGTIVLAQGTVGAEIARLYLEGETVSNSRSTQGVVIDGANAAAFFNHVLDVQCNHLHIGFQQTSSGSQPATQNYFDNCQSFGDVSTDTTSFGYVHGNGTTSGCGQLSVLTNCNWESCGTGIRFTSVSGPAVLIGQRFEAGTVDVLYDTNASGQTFFGGNPVNVTDNTGDLRNQYHGRWTGGNAVVPNSVAPTVFGASTATDVPMTAALAPTHTGNIFQVKNSAGTVVGGVSPSTNNLAPGLRPFGVAGISASATPANNLRGSQVFAGTTTAAVSFTVNEPDASYQIALSQNASSVSPPWITSQGTGGFTINFTANFTGTVYWFLVR